MEPVDVPQFVGLLVVTLGTAKALGALAQRIGQPAVLGKFLAGYAPVWFKGNKNVIGVGMIPRGEGDSSSPTQGLPVGSFPRPFLVPSL